MGKKGIEIVAAKIDVNEVIADLNKAYADEWCAHYQYWLLLNENLSLQMYNAFFKAGKRFLAFNSYI